MTPRGGLIAVFCSECGAPRGPAQTIARIGGSGVRRGVEASCLLGQTTGLGISESGESELRDGQALRGTYSVFI